MSKLVKEGGELGSKMVTYGRETASALLRRGRRRSGEIFKNVLLRTESKVQTTAKYIDDTLGVTEVREAQRLVCVKEDEFLKARADVRAAESLVQRRQSALSDTRAKLDRTDRSDDRYLSYVAEEHAVLLDVKRLQSDYQLAEDRERQKFSEFSSAVRASHEKERSRAERTKYWSLIGSISGTILGFLFSSLMSQHRLKELKSITVSAVLEANSPAQRDLEQCLQDAKAVAEQLRIAANQSPDKGADKISRGFIISEDGTQLYSPTVSQHTTEHLAQLEARINSKLDSFIAALNDSLVVAAEKEIEFSNEASLNTISESLRHLMAEFKERDIELKSILKALRDTVIALPRLQTESTIVSDQASETCPSTKADSLIEGSSVNSDLSVGPHSVLRNGDDASPDGEDVLATSESSDITKWSKSDQVAFLISTAALVVLLYAFRQ